MLDRSGGFNRGRLHRSELAVPATSARFLHRAASSDADVVFLDLEDSVQPARKDEARDLAVAALNEIDWGRKAVAVRINGLDTRWAYRDIIAVAENCPRLDLILLPKANRAADVHFVETLLDGIEAHIQRAKPIGIEVLIETAAGISNVEEIARSSQRLEALIFGVGDFALSIGARDQLTGGPNPRYAVLTNPEGRKRRERHWNDPWHYALARIVTTCRANGLRAIDGPFADFHDNDGYVACCERASALGFEGKWAIHPTQVGPANEMFSPEASELVWARDVIAKMQTSPEGAIAIDGKLIDIAHLKKAEALLKRQQIIDASR